MITIGIFGAQGRMGQAIAALIDQSADCAAGPAIDRDDDSGVFVPGCADVLIAFSTPAGLEAHLGIARALGLPIVIGTTGLEPTDHDAIDRIATDIPVLQTGNTSLGVTLLAHLIREAAARLGPDWDIEILEMHHRHKVDAPSGTALLLGEAAAQGRGIDLANHADRGRDGITGARAEGAIGFASLRGGSVAGDHSAIFATDQERLVLSHHAENRTIFARGALQAARWLIGKAPGRYTMQDVLAL